MECSHDNWTILGNERAGVDVTCRDCNQQISLKVALVQMNVRLKQLEIDRGQMDHRVHRLELAKENPGKEGWPNE